MPKVMSMPVTAYNRTICTIRDYPRMVYELEQLRIDMQSVGAVSYDGMPKGTAGAGGLEDKVIKINELEEEIKKIRECLNTVPVDMRNGVLNNVLYNTRYPVNEHGQLVPSLRTWKREKQKFIVMVAHKLRIY